MLDRFAIDLDHPSPRLNRWLTAMFTLFRPQIEALLIERDRVVAQWWARHPDGDVLEDRRLDITPRSGFPCSSTSRGSTANRSATAHDRGSRQAPALTGALP
jgi:hypothetical protein